VIYISAGHHPAAKGAEFNGFNEHDEATKWVAEIVSHISELCIVVPTGPLPGKIAFINSQPDAKLAFEIHFNSDESKLSHGSETLYAPGSKAGRIYADMVQEDLGGLFPPSRGIKEGWYRMILPPDPRAVPDAFLSKTKPVALIVEPEFIYNRTTIETGRTMACAILADTLADLHGDL
jgi:hypothetical protein